MKTLRNLKKKDKLQNYPVNWRLSRNSKALTMQYKEVNANEPVYERIQESPMAFQNVQPYAHNLNDETLRPTYDSALSAMMTLGNHPAVTCEDITEIEGGQALPSGRAMPVIRINDDGHKPIICIHTCTHGGENHSYHGVVTFIKHYLYSNDDLSLWLRNNIAFYWLAIPNPDGLSINNRRNAKGINLNRNWNYFWEYAADPDKGDAFMSEIENQNTDNFLSKSRKNRIISFLDVHGWWSRSSYGFLTDQIWGGDIRAYKQQRAAYLYVKSIMEKRDWHNEFSLVNEPPTPTERRSSRKPYISYAIRNECRPDAWTGQFEYSHQENVGVGSTACLDAITGICMAARDTLAPERMGVVCTGKFAATDIINENSHFTQGWHTYDNRPKWFSNKSLTVQEHSLEDSHYTETSVITNRPESSNWPIFVADASALIIFDETLDTKGHAYVAGGETIGGSYTNHFYREQLMPPPPPKVGDNMFGIYLPKTEQERLPNLPYRAKGVQITNDSHFIYVFGGFNGDYQKDIYRIAIADIADKQWELVHTVTAYSGEGLNRHGMDYWNGHLVITGGRTAKGYRAETLLVDVTSWKETVIKRVGTTDDFYSARGWHSTQIVGDELFVIGGWTGSTTLSSVYRINLLNHSRYYHPMPNTRRRGCVSYVPADNALYLIGGVSGSTSTPKFLKPITLDLTDHTWSDYSYTLDAFVDEDGDTVTIPDIEVGGAVMVFNEASNELMLIGGFTPTQAATGLVYAVDLEADEVTRRKTNDAKWGYIRPSVSFPAEQDQVYVLSVAVERLDTEEQGKNAYVRPCLYAGEWGENMRKIRIGYSVPPNTGWHIYSVPLQLHAGFTPKIRAFLRHYGGGTRCVIGAMQITKGQLHGTLIPPSGKEADNLTITFEKAVSVSNSVTGVFSPMWGSQQATSGQVNALNYIVDPANTLQSLSLDYSATTTGVFDDTESYKDFTPNGHFILNWNDGTDRIHIFDTVELNHDRYAPAWRKDAIHWRLRYLDGELFFDLWFYNNAQTVSLGNVSSHITGAEINGTNIVCKVA